MFNKSMVKKFDAKLSSLLISNLCSAYWLYFFVFTGLLQAYLLK